MTAPKPRRRSIRFAIVAVVCLLLGAVTTVGVAWRASLLPSDRTRPWSAASAWPWSVPPDWPPPQVMSTGEGPGWELEDARTPERSGHPDSFSVVVKRSGWPIPAVVSVQHSRIDHPRPLPSGRGWRFDSMLTGLVYRDDLGFDYGPLRWLPLTPLASGFAVDTALYAAAWYLLIFTPLPLIRFGRRRFRLSRGMCGSCGYDLKGSSSVACPECGKVAEV